VTNKGRQVVKKLHLRVASSGYPGTIPVPYPLHAATPGRGWHGEGLSTLRIMSVNVIIRYTLMVLTELSPVPFCGK
jgi:hypothetical protein